MTPEHRRIKHLDELTEVEFIFQPDPPEPPVISRAMMDVFVKELLIDAKKMYDANVCMWYHTWDHVLHVFSSYVMAFGDASPEVEAAIGFHDVIYVPGVGNGTNELLSARYLEACVRRQGSYFTAQAEKFDLKLAVDIILRTAVQDHLSPRDTLEQRCFPGNSLEVSRVCDADLSSLAMPWPEFVHNQENIIIEQTGVRRKEITAEHRAASAKFLSAFLDLDSIYYNDSAKELWEDRAWYNIVRWVRENNVRLS